MPIEFDPTKDSSNQAKHGVSLALAEGFEWEMALVLEDTRMDYGEVRYQALGPIGDGLYMLVFTPRGENVRAISLRKASRQEKQKWRTATL